MRAIVLTLVALAFTGSVHAQSAEPASQCRLEGTYRSNAGFYTRFDGRGSWGSFNSDPGPRADPALGGRYFVHGNLLSFVADAERCRENTAVYTMTFARDCQRVEIRLTQDGCHMTDGPVSYVFVRTGG